MPSRVWFREEKENKNMNEKYTKKTNWRALWLVFALLVIGGCGGLLYSNTFQNQPTHEHKAIAERFVVKDVTKDFYLTLKHRHTDIAEFYPTYELQITPGETYVQSLWVWCTKDDIDVVMSIWGPGDDGLTYLVVFARMMGNEALITGCDQTIHWMQGTTEGYASLEVRLQTT